MRTHDISIAHRQFNPADKKKYGKSQLLSSDFVEFLDDYLGMEPVDLKSKGSANPGGKNFQ